MPETVTIPSTLSGHAAEIYRSAFLSAYEGTCAKPEGRRGGKSVSRDACAAKIAWGAVKEKYEQGKKGKWIAKSADPVTGPISGVPSAPGEQPMFGTGMDRHKGERGTRMQRWRIAYIKALQGECLKVDKPVECARRKANILVGFVDTDVKPIQRGGEGSGHHEHAGRPGEVGGSAPSDAGGAGAPKTKGAEKRETELEQEEQATEIGEAVGEQEPKAPEHWEVYPPKDVSGELVAWGYEPQDPRFEWNEYLDVVGQIPTDERMSFVQELPNDTREMTADERWDLAKVMLDMPPETLFDYETRLQDRPNVGYDIGAHGVTPDTIEMNEALRLQGLRDVVYGSASYLRQMQRGSERLESEDFQTQALGRQIIREAQRDIEFDVMGYDWWDEKDQDTFRAEWASKTKAEGKSMIDHGGMGSGHRGHVGRSGDVMKSYRRSTTMDKFKDYPLNYVERREFDTATRKKMAEAGTAMPCGSFPIATCEDVTNALRSLGRTSKPRHTVIAHIRKRAKALGCKMTPALKEKAAAIDRYLERQALRTRANEVDLNHIRTLGNNPIDRPDYISSQVWRSLPTEHRTVRAEATRRIIERNYAQAVEDAEMSGWRVHRNHYSPEEFYFTKRFPIHGQINEVMIRALMVRSVDSVDWCLRAMSGGAAGSIAQMLPEDIVRHRIKDRSKLPFLKG